MNYLKSLDLALITCYCNNVARKCNRNIKHQHVRFFHSVVHRTMHILCYIIMEWWFIIAGNAKNMKPVQNCKGFKRFTFMLFTLLKNRFVAVTILIKTHFGPNLIQPWGWVTIYHNISYHPSPTFKLYKISYSDSNLNQKNQEYKIDK